MPMNRNTPEEIGAKVRAGKANAARTRSDHLDPWTPIGSVPKYAPLGTISGQPANPNRARFAISRNLHHAQFGQVYERDPEQRQIATGHFTGGVIYHHDSAAPGRER